MYADGTPFYGTFAEGVGAPQPEFHSWDSQSTIVLSTQDEERISTSDNILQGIISTIEEFDLDKDVLNESLYGEFEMETDDK